MPASDVTPLRAVRSAVANQLAQRAAQADAPLGELRELQERLHLLDAALAESEQAPKRHWQVPLVLALVVATLVSLAAAIPVRRVPFTLDLQARAVSLQFDDKGELSSQAVDSELRVGGFTRLESPATALAKAAAQSSPDHIALNAPQLSLRRVVYLAGSVLIVEAGPQVHLSLQASRSPVVAELEFTGPTTWHFGDTQSRQSNNYAHLEWTRLIGGDSAAPNRRPPPLDLWLERPAGRNYTWKGLHPVALEFIERSAATQAVVTSSLEQASITLPATGAEVRLADGDRLELTGLELERFELVVGDRVGLKLSGSARTLATRTGDFERSLKPSLLEFVARNHTIGLFWSAAVMLWGVVAWLRKQFDAEKP